MNFLSTQPLSHIRPSHSRRGNTLVLVAGILVLLVIIATAYLSRAQAGRVTASAQPSAELRDDRVESIARDVAEEVSSALFVRTVEPTLTPGVVVDSNTLRNPSSPDAVRYGVDPYDQAINNTLYDMTPGSSVGSDGEPDGYNFAPYEVRPWTNWPDDTAPFSLWPRGFGAPGGQTSLPAGTPLRASNPVGNPGFGDTRWLRSTEPYRQLIDPDGIPNSGDEFEEFTHWPHLTNIARPNNGWRICRDISNIFIDTNGDTIRETPNVITNLNVPVEQWLVDPLPTVYSSSPPGFAGWFRNQVRPEWFDNYGESYLGISTRMPNLFRLKDAGPPETEFQGPGTPGFSGGTPRWAVSTTFTDTDGDGFTDSYWFLAPTMVERDIRQVVGVSIVDNSALLNANVATMFLRKDLPDITLYNNVGTLIARTKGLTPSDVALTTPLDTHFTFPNDTLVGFFNTPLNEASVNFYQNNTDPGVTVDWLPTLWDNDAADNTSFLREIGVQDNNEFLTDPMQTQQLYRESDRMEYWKYAGMRPLDPTNGLTPFNLSDEIELRMFHGQNYPWLLSRFERAVNNTGATDSFLRSAPSREESVEYLDQLTNAQLVRDNRRKLTLFSGARNDTMPPSLWPDADTDCNGDGMINIADYECLAQEDFLDNVRKIDLRDPLDTNADIALFREKLESVLNKAMIKRAGGGSGATYFGAGKRDETEAMIASFAANIEAWRDTDDDTLPLNQTIRFNEDPAGNDLRFIGQERHPFIMEVFIAHVYAKSKITGPVAGSPDDYTVPGDEYPNGGEHVVDSGSSRTTVVAVQLGNPYHESISLNDFQLRVFGRNTPLQGSLGPTTVDQPRSIVVYSIIESFDDPGTTDMNFRANWLDFLDLTAEEMFGSVGVGTVGTEDTILLNATGNWSTEPDDYRDSSDKAIELVKNVGSDEYVLDRIDNPNSDLPTQYRDAVNTVTSNAADRFYAPPDRGFFYTGIPNDPRNFYNGIRIGDDDFYMSWAGTTRAFGFDVDGSGFINPNERSPRFVFSQTSRPRLPETVNEGFEDGRENEYLGDTYIFPGSGGTPGDPADPEPATGANPWISLRYIDSQGNQRLHKPTFFPCQSVYGNNGGDQLATYDNFVETIAVNPGDNDEVQFLNTPGVYPGDKGISKDELTGFPNDPLQMLHKDDDFEQVGELLHVFLFGPLIEITPSFPPNYDKTVYTFSEMMVNDENADYPVEQGLFVNRLQFDENRDVITADAGYKQSLPAGVSLFDAFVCDGRGRYSNNPIPILFKAPRNAMGFRGRTTPGLININTAPIEVLRALPHMTELVHADDTLTAEVFDPPVRLPEAINQYRERLGTELPTDTVPNYSRRGQAGSGEYIPEMRGERGFAGLGELLLLQRKPMMAPTGLTGPDVNVYQDSWLSDFSGRNPYSGTGSFTDFVGGGGGYNDPMPEQRVTELSTDTMDPIFLRGSPTFRDYDLTGGDTEERNQLFAGISNLITTRSDVFTVYLKVRTFRQDPVSGKWDATDRENIIDDSRYVMLIDRGEVESPGDRAKILYFEKVPN